MERGKLTQALDCLQHAHKLAPHENYILKHLKIVQQRLANLKQTPGMYRQKNIAFAKYDPKDFGGTTTSDNGFVNGNQRDDIMMAAKESDKTNDNAMSTKRLLKNELRRSKENTETMTSTQSFPSENQNSPDKSTISLDETNFIANNIDPKINDGEQQQTNSKYRNRKQQFIHDNSIPMFVHDMDDPSSGTS